MRNPERHQRGLVDTSVVIDLGHIDAAALPGELAVSAITMAELAAGPHATDDLTERARRQDRLQRAEASFDPVPFDDRAARSYGRVSAAVLAAGPKARGARAVDLLIAATALANRLPLFTRTRTTSRLWKSSLKLSTSPEGRPSGLSVLKVSRLRRIAK